ncbi:chaplin [Streptomyces sp. PR69]|uniref:chaplin n=1 Tax=Streptomyces sp. PR69 TaxID=2984950 RepID=UPI002B27A10D|nr:chaplin [Streptomyces sp. PR69]
MKSYVRAGIVAVTAGAALLMGGAGAATAHDDGSGAHAKGVAVGSPGVLSGNLIQVPVHVPVNVCGNTVNILIGIANPAFGNTCINS